MCPQNQKEDGEGVDTLEETGKGKDRKTNGQIRYF